MICILVVAEYSVYIISKVLRGFYRGKEHKEHKFKRLLLFLLEIILFVNSLKHTETQYKVQMQ